MNEMNETPKELKYTLQASGNLLFVCEFSTWTERSLNTSCNLGAAAFAATQFGTFCLQHLSRSTMNRRINCLQRCHSSFEFPNEVKNFTSIATFADVSQ